MYLLDTNILLERLLDQASAEIVAQLLARIPSDQLSVTDFSVHSIGVILNRLEKQSVFIAFIQDLFVEGEVTQFALQPSYLVRVVNVMQTWKLDFDDAYQYVAADVYNAVLVSFDSDFDRKEQKRMRPAELLYRLKTS